MMWGKAFTFRLERRVVTVPEISSKRVESQSLAATGEKSPRQITGFTRRIILVILGVSVVLASILGFYFVSEVFDERTSVLVSAVDINKGEKVSAELFSSEMAVIGSIPHIPFSQDVAAAFEGWIAAESIPAGAIVLDSMLIPPATKPVGNQLELVLPITVIDVTGAVDVDAQLYERDIVLLIDPGVAPTAVNPGEPRQVIELLSLQNFDSASNSMTLFLEPKEWNLWQMLLDKMAGSLTVLPAPLGINPEQAQEFAQEIETVLLSRWEDEVNVARTSLSAGLKAEPGTLEVIVTIDTSLVPSGVSEGDQVLLIDPGQPPSSGEIGRPRRVIETITLENFDGSTIRLFAEPEEWLQWQSLPVELGATPMVLPIPSGTDIDDMIDRLNREWETVWQIATNELNSS